ncbi:TPA: N-6 DNA methylase [Mannheimia haemolytica]|uniref:site-specific DNA-methyltransferase (adenine-specific) n=4 Tax=Mannheimia haemolytica TaxID=75985 RepID=A0A547EGV8_MANHA|nr:N-6 DNA methylase [Mannheimia haemolytica]AWW72479.1 SAM-dependent methyltransferase [Pasteurellaceae bacterium 12565]AGI34282.1 SAM-dependent methyltransferase [Mannheimia haemolytica USDA-ARS-USMARC-185]AGK01280.1 site-specific modification DNA-methyltransferase Eco57IBM [Mannheimia haemolytica M42548]AGQ25674.1 modification methylase [Mannheimia haemolytica D153]AGQ41670.1 modification methylase [Mannheimia haemolytica D174]
MKFKDEQTEQKLRGGYYTPQYLADYITKWVLGINPSSILEPSCGDGRFIQALFNNNSEKEKNITCFELIDSEADKSKYLLKSLGFNNFSVYSSDFLRWSVDNFKADQIEFEGIIGNPPFIRYQYLNEEFQESAKNVFDLLNFKFTKHTNSWVSFLISSLSFLKEGGRLGMIIPSEILNVIHAQSLRDFISQGLHKVLIINPKNIWFENTLQGALIILIEKVDNESKKGISILNVEDDDFINIDPNKLFVKSKYIDFKDLPDKWVGANLTEEELSLINKVKNHRSVYKFSDIATVEVGIVTGANDFFLVNDHIVSKYKLDRFVYPMFGKSQHCKGIIYDNEQHFENKEKNLPTNFIYLEDNESNLPLLVQTYIKEGEDAEYHKRYKCKIRKPWYKVPSVYSTNIGMLKRSHEAPKLILNKLGAYTTDTAYRIKSNKFQDEILVCCFLNPLTMILSELNGRFYGGGVLELVPSEIRNLYIPIIENIDFNIEELNEEVKAGNIENVIRNNGEKILTNLGFSQEDNAMLMSIWKKLKNNRLRR